MQWIFMVGMALMLGGGLLSAQERLTFDQCVAESLRESESLRSVEASIDAAQADADSTFWSFFPTASINVSYLKLYFEPEPEGLAMPSIPGFDLSGAFDMPEWSRTLDITVAQPVTPLWSVWKGHDAQTMAREIEEIKKRSTADQIRVKAAEYFYSYLMIERLDALLADTVKQLDRYETQAQNFVDAGLTDKRAVLKVKLEKARLEKERQTVAGNRTLLKRALALLMNRDMESFAPFSESPDEIAPVPALDRLLALQDEHRAEIAMLDRADLVASTLQDIAIQPLVPTIALTGGYKHNFDATTFSPEGTFFVGAVLSWDFGFDTMKQINSFKKARGEKTKMRLANIDVRKQLRLQVTQLYTDLMVKEKEIAIATAEREVAAENLRIEESKYQEKLTTETDLLAANLQERQAKTSYITAIFQYKIALQKLAGTIGVPATALNGN